MNATKHRATEVDGEIGRRLRQARKDKRLSQTELGQKAGVTFQQVQKYENGSNRLSSSALVTLSRALGVRPGHFLDDLADIPAAEAPTWRSGVVAEMCSDEQGLDMIEAWPKLSSDDKRTLVSLAQKLTSRPLERAHAA